MASSNGQPEPRWGHATVAYGTKVYLWGGRLDFSLSSKKTCAEELNVFDVGTEAWEQKKTKPGAPQGLYNNAHAVLGGCLYIYGGFDGHHSFNTLHRLDLTYLDWKALSKPQDTAERVPMKMTGCGMVTCGDHTLVLFGGFGTPSCEAQPGYTFLCQVDPEGGGNSSKGWTNELWCYDVVKEEWSCPAIAGDLPPPCADFIFTEIGHDRAVLFGGYKPETGASADLYILDMTTWKWTKVGPPSKDSLWPKGRDGHASTTIHSRGKSYVVIDGGWDSNSDPINDTWMLDTADFSWHQLELSWSSGRFWHTITAVGDSPILTQLVIFGGCPMGGDKWPKLADTVMVELGFFDSDVRWTVIDVVDHRRLGNPLQRMKERLILSEFHSRQLRGSSMSLAQHPPTNTSPVHLTNPPVITTTGREFQPVDTLTTPCWSIPKSMVVILKDELGKGKTCVTKVGLYQGSKVAAKCLHGNIVTENNRAVFLETLSIVAALKHPNLVSFIGAVLDDAHPVILCELMPQSLKALLDHTSLPNHQVVGIATDVAHGLCYLHGVKPHPIVHGELRSAGVLVEPSSRGGSYRAKLGSYLTSSFTLLHPEVQQFHVAKQPAVRSPITPSPPPSTLIKRATFVLEPHNPFNPSPKRDTYNFGLLLVEMATRSSPIDVALAYLMESITWSPASTVVRRCVEVEPAARPTMEEVIAMLSKPPKQEGMFSSSPVPSRAEDKLTAPNSLPEVSQGGKEEATKPIPSTKEQHKNATPTHEASSPPLEPFSTPSPLAVS